MDVVPGSLPQKNKTTPPVGEASFLDICPSGFLTFHSFQKTLSEKPFNSFTDWKFQELLSLVKTTKKQYHTDLEKKNSRKHTKVTN